MASIYKRGRDADNKMAPYLIAYVDHNGRKRTKRGFTDKGLTEQLAKQIDNDVRKRRSGLVDPLEDELATQRRRPIAEHLADFETHLRTKSSTSKHVNQTLSRLHRLTEVCGIKTVVDLNKSRVEKGMRTIRDDDDLGNRTFNHYVQGIDSFCRWLVANQRLAANPLAGLVRLNTQVDVRHKRRALSMAEVVQLVQSARNSGKAVQGYTGEQRARCYLLSFMTGLRRKEMASLTAGSFALDADLPTVTVEAACSKHRHKDVLPLHPELVAELRLWLDGLAPDEKLFPKLERKKTWLMVKTDLEAVGIPYETPEGIADFHAAGRHSHVTELFRSGAAPTQVRELARHSDIRMTMRYTHVGLADQANALAGISLPVSPPPQQETTENAPVDDDQPPQGRRVPQDDQQETWQYIGRTLAVLEGLLRSLPVTGGASAPEAEKRKKPGETGPFDAEGHPAAPSDTNGKKWRRRESNLHSIAA